jgi:hypothetical protein
MNDTQHNFIIKHDIKIVDSNKQRRSVQHPQWKYFSDKNDYNLISIEKDAMLYTEKVLTIEITENELSRIAEFESQVFNHMRDAGHYNMFERLMNLKNEEKTIRRSNPAVQKAYEQYSLLLQLAKESTL